MFNTIWKIRREWEGYYRITLDPNSFGYDTFPISDREWVNDNVEDLMNEARIVTQSHTQAFDHYGKMEEYGGILFDVDEAVIKEVRYKVEREVQTYVGCLILVALALLFITILLL